MPDMSKWLADQPGTTGQWWQQQASVVPRGVQVEFNAFVAALNTYNFANTPANQDALSARVSALIEAIPNVNSRMPGRERIASVLPKGKLQTMMHSSTANASKGESENLLLALKNLMGTLGVHLVPKAYRDI
jgi:hypothetical protein